MTQEKSPVGKFNADAKSELGEGVGCPGNHKASRHDNGGCGDTQRAECTGAVDNVGLIESVMRSARLGEQCFDEAALTIRA